MFRSSSFLPGIDTEITKEQEERLEDLFTEREEIRGKQREKNTKTFQPESKKTQKPNNNKNALPLLHCTFAFSPT